MKKLLAALLLMATPAMAYEVDVLVQWTDAGKEDEYRVQRERGPCAAPLSTPVSVATVGANVLEVMDTVQDNETYCYRVYAVYRGQVGAPKKAEITVGPVLNDFTVTVTEQ